MLEKIFHLQAKNTTIKTEFLAGFTIFLSMLYIIPVASEILSHAGMPKEALITAVTLVTILATFVSGVYANTPVAMSVGMGLNVYFAFGIVQGLGIAWQQALGLVFISGFIFFILSFTRFRIWILQSIPKNLRFALCVGLGVFLATIGLKGMGFFVLKDGNLLLGEIANPTTLLSIIGIFVILFLFFKRIKGAFILGIVLVSCLGFGFGLASLPKGFVSLPASLSPIAFELDILGVLQFSFVPIVVALMITDLFDSLGTLSGVGVKARMFQDFSKQDKDLEKTLQVDAGASMLGSVLGVSTTTSFLESATGVAEGGRTGLCAVFVAVFFGLALFLLPLFLAIPSFAVYPVLVVVGTMMFLEISNIDFSDAPSFVASFFMILLMPLTTSITIGLSAGFLVYLFLCLVLKQYNKINAGLIVIALLSLIPFIL